MNKTKTMLLAGAFLLAACGSEQYANITEVAEARDCNFDEIRYGGEVEEYSVQCDNGMVIYWYSDNDVRDFHESFGKAFMGDDGGAKAKGDQWAEYKLVQLP
jgi:hypothetical protein